MSALQGLAASRAGVLIWSAAARDSDWATIAEVFLIQRQYADAARLYDSAVAMARKETGSHKSTWMQARRLMDKLEHADADRTLVRKAFGHLPEGQAA
jgi:hypothetical protein